MIPILGKLLVVDDDEANRDMLCRRLHRAGHSVTPASGSREALALIERDEFDLVLLDIMMPEISGLEALGAIRRSHSPVDLPVIMVTAKSQSEDIVRAFELGANDYATKPIDFPVLLARIQTHLQLKHLTRLKDDFMSVLSHDLKNPLAIILGVTSLVESMVRPNEPLSPDVYDLLMNIRGSAKRMKLMIDDFLDFKVLEGGHMRLDRARFDLNALARRVLADNAPYARQKGIGLGEALDASLPLVDGDERRLEQVIQNLVDNAIKFSSAGAQATIRTFMRDGRAVLEVVDSGPGLREADFGQVFTKYAKLSNRPTGDEKSTGLGLAICKQIMEAHGGALAVRNNEGAGATFWLEVPLAVEASEPIAT